MNKLLIMSGVGKVTMAKVEEWKMRRTMTMQSAFVLSKVAVRNFLQAWKRCVGAKFIFS